MYDLNENGLPKPSVSYTECQPSSLLTLSHLPSYSTSLHALMQERATNSLLPSTATGLNLHHQRAKSKDDHHGKKSQLGGSDCGTSSTECPSDYSDQNSTGGESSSTKTNVYNVSTSRIVTPTKSDRSSTKSNERPVVPTPAPRMIKSEMIPESKEPESLSERRRRQESLV